MQKGDTEHASWIERLIEYINERLVEVRTALFSDHTSDRSVFLYGPDRLPEIGFLKDDRRLITAEAKRIARGVDYVKASLSDDSLLQADPVTKAKRISLLYSRNGGPICGKYRDLIDQLRRLPKGLGCCSDHSQAFIALSSMLGLESREVHHSIHTFNEFYDSDRCKWIWIDTQYALFAQNTKGEYLSLMEIRDAYMMAEKVIFIFFGSEAHFFSHSSPYEHVYYSNKKVFGKISMTLGNNVFEQDIMDRKYAYIPRFIRQFIGILTHKYPRYLFYVENKSKIREKD